MVILILPFCSVRDCPMIVSLVLVPASFSFFSYLNLPLILDDLSYNALL